MSNGHNLKAILDFLESGNLTEDNSRGGVVEQIVQKQVEEIDQIIIKKMLASVKVDWKKIIYTVELWEEKELINSAEPYMTMFERYFFDIMPHRERQLLITLRTEANDKDSPLARSAKELLDRIIDKVRSIGAAIYQVRNTKFCANTKIPPACTADCYYYEACKIRITN